MKLTIRYWLRDYFGFSRRESNGFLVLSVLLLLILFVPLSYPLFDKKDTHLTQDQQELDKLLTGLPQPEPSSGQFNPKSKSSNASQVKTQLFFFDPNTVSYEELRSLGFSSKVANNLIKYRNKGAKFYKPSQIERIYGMDKAFFEKIAPYMRFPERYASGDAPSSYKKDKYEQRASKQQNKEDKPSSERRNYTSPRIEAFDLNQADAITLRQLRGIGEKLSARIVAYREKLGGFIRLEQLSEVYGLTPEAIEEIKKYAQITHEVRKLPINQIDAKTLAQHPYIETKQAQTIINYRTQHGRFENLEALKNIKSISTAWIEKLAPYLSFE